MGVIAEWWWSCDVPGCNQAAEEPWGAEDAAQSELAAHMTEEHPEQGEVDG